MESGFASAVKTPAVGIRIEVREGETLEQAVLRFRKAVSRQRGWWWRSRPKYGKRRLDYYLKPSELRRQKALTDRIRKRRGSFRWQGNQIWEWERLWKIKRRLRV